VLAPSVLARGSSRTACALQKTRPLRSSAALPPVPRGTGSGVRPPPATVRHRKGQLKTLSFTAPIDILANSSKNGDKQPDYRVYSRTVEVGAGWIKKGQTSGEDYISLSLADPAFGPKKLYANLGRAAGQDDKDVFAVIWNTAD
jgi:uncharacterized protein (DUF736 family)